MYLYFCNDRGCTGHIKGWERCDDLLAAPSARERLARSRIAQVPAGEDRAAEPQAANGTSISGQEPLNGADITWI
ncbi:hypothetical protein [Desulfocurvibacter africanus]|uniref:Uncharacterized protein n=2 Tax=Desulfocurvibacter africanus TaxID=873 RepID=F3YU17_DESAF|nr:hypothetical protein [Desulfocurvibacter africanus]EGJ48623.1 hypothetical protein Desaf_0265 [Desulfocurvibacter africanus subsp. africanus str. Walvis Bay]